MSELEDWSLPELLDVVVESDQLPVRVMEHVLERRQDALPALISRVLEISQARSDDVHSLWLMVLLGQLREPEAVPALLTVLRNVAPNASPEAMVCSEALARIGSAAIPALQTFLADAEPRQRLWVYAAAGLMTDAAAAQLLRTALTTDTELAEVIATALADHGDRSVIPDLYSALHTCSPWQRTDIEDAIKALHHHEPSNELYLQDWRLRYRVDPEIGMLKPSWAVVSDILREKDAQEKRSIAEVRPLAEILADPRDHTEPERCDCCGVEVWAGTGVPVCPATALDVAFLQHQLLGRTRDQSGADDLFDVLDLVEDQLGDLMLDGPPKRNKAREKWHDEGSLLHLQRAACMWAFERGAQSVGGARAMLLTEALSLAERYSDPHGVFKPAHTTRTETRVGRNDPCPCGSGRKYKKCCGRAEPAATHTSHPPQLLTAGHEMLTFSKAFYSVSNRAAVSAALENCRLLDYDSADESFVWFEDVNGEIRRVLGTIRSDDDGLVLEAMSEARLGRLKTLVQSLCGDWLAHRSDSHHDAAQLLADARRTLQ